MTEAGLERVAGGAAPVLDRVTRLGFATKGLLTILVGVLALRHALGQGGRLTGQEGAIRTLRDQPFGQVALVVLTVGLSAYALWMFVSAFVDPQGKGTRLVGIVERVSFFVTGIGYATLAFGSLNLLLRKGGVRTGLDDLAAGVLTPVFGRWLVGLAGAAVVIAGILQMRLGVTAGVPARSAAGPFTLVAQDHHRERPVRLHRAGTAVPAGRLVAGEGGSRV